MNRSGAKNGVAKKLADTVQQKILVVKNFGEWTLLQIWRKNLAF